MVRLRKDVADVEESCLTRLGGGVGQEGAPRDVLDGNAPLLTQHLSQTFDLKALDVQGHRFSVRRGSVD